MIALFGLRIRSLLHCELIKKVFLKIHLIFMFGLELYIIQ
jgi:hypothetical protein